MKREEIESAVNELFGEETPNFNILCQKKAFIDGINCCNSKQPYSAEDMQSYLRFGLSFILQGKYPNAETNDELIKLWGESKNG